MSVHAYPSSLAFADAARTGLGAAIVGAPLAFAQPVPAVAAVLAALLLAFVVFGGMAIRRHLGRVEADGGALVVNGRRLPWSEVQSIRLAYFSTRRDRENGWFQLTIAGQHRRIAVESALDDFRAIAAKAALAAAVNRLELDAATRANFAALAIPLPEPAP